MNAITTVPAIEWPAPTINKLSDALDDTACSTERLRALLNSNSADFCDLITSEHIPDGWARRQLNNFWMIYVLAGEKLDEIDRLIAAMAQAVDRTPVSSVGKHTKLRRSQGWRAAADALNAANASGDLSDEGIAAAGAAFTYMLETRVSSPADLREKLMLISATRHGIQDDDLDEVFRDFDALGWTSAQAEG